MEPAIKGTTEKRVCQDDIDIDLLTEMDEAELQIQQSYRSHSQSLCANGTH